MKSAVRKVFLKNDENAPARRGWELFYVYKAYMEYIRGRVSPFSTLNLAHTPAPVCGRDLSCEKC